MKSALPHFCIILCVVAVFDLLFGMAIRWYLFSYTPADRYNSLCYTLDKGEEDILILGSSVAQNGINTERLINSIGIDAYNGAIAGQAFPFYVSELISVMSRRTPKLIVVGFTPANLASNDLGINYGMLKPFYGKGNEYLYRNLESASSLEPLLLKSNLYRYNKVWWSWLVYHISPLEDGENIKGYIPAKPPLIYPTKETALIPGPSPMALDCITKMVDMARDGDIGIIFVMPPSFRHYEGMEKFSEISHIIDSYDKARFWNDIHLLPFNQDSTLFFDNTHMNLRGADMYTDTLGLRIREYMNLNKVSKAS